MAVPSELTGSPPGVAGLAAFLKEELAPRPGRLADCLRITLLTLLVVIVSETFRVPLTAYSAYIVFFVSKEETASTVLTGIVLTIAVSLSVLAAIFVYMFSAGEPGLRLPMMALVAFAGLFLSRVSALGPAAFASGFVMTLSLTLIDKIPPFAGLPPSEILTQSVLWLWVVVMIPIGLVVLVNLVAGRDPAGLFREELAARLDLSARLLSGSAGGDSAERRKFAALSRTGVGDSLRHLQYEGLLKRPAAIGKTGGRTMAAAGLRVTMTIGAWLSRDHGRPGHPPAPPGYPAAIQTLARRLTGERTEAPSVRSLSGRGERLQRTPWERRLLDRLGHFIDALADGVNGRNSRAGVATPKGQGGGLIRPESLADPEHLRFALKTTLAAMLAYFAYTLLDWPEIRTAMITCFFVTFGNLGESVHRMTLRLTGATIGGGLGLLAVIFVMPALTSITGLCLTIGGLAFVAAWIATSSDRLAYAGMQMALAFFLCILVEHGPHIELAMARDRLVGILLGNLIVSLVFLNIWPVSVVGQARAATAATLRHLGRLISTAGEEDDGLLAFDAALARARRLSTFDRFEPERLKEGTLDPSILDLAENLAQLALILSSGEDGLAAYRRALAGWLEELARTLSDDSKGADLPQPPPAAPSGELLPDGDTDWQVVLARHAWDLHRTLASHRADRGIE